ncbi:MAG: Z1 domain-containing protein [Bacteroidetes bacterium]|nr:Z1 domain-containing protein [Bacteroidota bacterium]
MNSYQRIKEHIFANLTRKQYESSVLEITEIDSEIDDVKKLIAIPEAVKLVFKQQLTPLENFDWARMKRELETHFDVKMENGILMQGKEQQKRDTIWWTSLQKQRTENYYWERYKKYISGFFSPEVVKTIDTDTDVVMDNIENPELHTFSRYGMVVGHVQSGKTANYSALVCKAADAGYKFIVVIAGGINNLRNQTQGRLNESFVGQDKGTPVGAGIGYSKRERLPISLTTIERDFNKQDADRNSHTVNFDNISVPILLVIKKNTRTLSNVISWLKNQYKNQVANHAMLLIDDESDYASINVNEEADPSTINKKLRKLLSLFYKSSYVAYTATPYANIFIDHEAGQDDLGRDLFPKDFIYALDAPSNYFGARKIFVDTDDKHLISIDDYLEDIPPKHKKDFSLPSIPQSLYDAIRLFLLNIAIRALRGQKEKHNSMLVHVTRFTMVHQKTAAHIEIYVSKIKKEINAYCKLPDAEKYSKTMKDLKATLEYHYPNGEFGWNKVIESLCSIVDTILVREVHQKTKIPLEYRKDINTNVIVVGGTSLSRGFTLEGLSVSYFLRNTIFYDTLMQMGRWFGYRSEYEDLCRIYLPPTMIENFGYIIEATDDLINDFKIMSDAKRTPYDFGLSVRQHPESVLQVTARNKQKNVKKFIFSMKLDGKAKETGWLSDNIEDRKINLLAIENIISMLKSKNITKVGNSFLWADIDKSIVLEFLSQFKTYQTDPLGITARMPIDFVRKYVIKRDTKWDVAIYSGQGKGYTIGDININKELRKVVRRNGYFELNKRQVATGTAESIALPNRSKLGSNRSEIRNALKKPLLMLHILQTDEDEKLAAFGISFPGNILSTDETINLTINTVLYQSLIEFEEEDED